MAHTLLVGILFLFAQPLFAGFETGQCAPNVLRAEIHNPAPESSDYFGQSVSIWENLAVVGAHRDDYGATRAGTATVFDATTGAITATLANPAPAFGQYFGYSVAISGNLAVVGALLDHSAGDYAGAAYVFDATTGAPVTSLVNPTPAYNDYFGWSVAISGNLAVVGAKWDDPGGLRDAGTAYVFNATTGALVATLDNPSPSPFPFSTAGDTFGSSVAISGNLAVVGSLADSPDGLLSAGSAYVFDATTGALLRTLNNPDPAVGDWFGGAVAISGGRAVVGALGDSPEGLTHTGAAFVFDAAGGELLATLRNPEATAHDRFGSSVAISDDVVVVGAEWDDPAGFYEAGTAYVFNATNGHHVATLKNPAPAPGSSLEAGNFFGASVAVSGSIAIVGALQQDIGGWDAGRAYTFTCTQGRPAGDFDNSGCTDLSDLFFVLDHWQAVSPAGPEIIDLSDFLALVDNWWNGLGC